MQVSPSFVRVTTPVRENGRKYMGARKEKEIAQHLRDFATLNQRIKLRGLRIKSIAIEYEEDK